jgi:hypothetical protein
MLKKLESLHAIERHSYYATEKAFRMLGVAQAADFIIGMVQDGPKDNLDIIDAGKLQRIPENDIRRAAKLIKVAEQKYETNGSPRPGKARGRRWRRLWGATEEICEKTGLPGSFLETVKAS